MCVGGDGGRGAGGGQSVRGQVGFFPHSEKYLSAYLAYGQLFFWNHSCTKNWKSLEGGDSIDHVPVCFTMGRSSYTLNPHPNFPKPIEMKWARETRTLVAWLESVKQSSQGPWVDSPSNPSGKDSHRLSTEATKALSQKGSWK